MSITENLDMETVEQLEMIATDDKEFIITLLETFDQNSKSQIEELQKFLEAKDWTSLKNGAHQLKGSASNVGARTMRLLCKDLEDNAIAKKKDEAQDTLNSIASAFTTCKGALAEYFKV